MSIIHQPKRDPINQKGPGGPSLGTIYIDLADQTYIFHFFQLKHYSFTIDLTPLPQCNTKGAKCKRRRRKEKKKIDHQHVANISRPIFDRRTTNQKHHHQNACARGEGNYNGLKIFLKSGFSNLTFYSVTASQYCFLNHDFFFKNI